MSDTTGGSPAQNSGTGGRNKRGHDLIEDSGVLIEYLLNYFLNNVPEEEDEILPSIDRSWIMVWFTKQLLKSEPQSKTFVLLASAVSDSLTVGGLIKSEPIKKISRKSKKKDKKDQGVSWMDVIDGTGKCSVDACTLVKLMASRLANRTGLSVVHRIQENYKSKHNGSLNF